MDTNPTALERVRNERIDVLCEHGLSNKILKKLKRGFKKILNEECPNVGRLLNRGKESIIVDFGCSQKDFSEIAEAFFNMMGDVYEHDVIIRLVKVGKAALDLKKIPY